MASLSWATVALKLMIDPAETPVISLLCFHGAKPFSVHSAILLEISTTMEQIKSQTTYHDSVMNYSQRTATSVRSLVFQLLATVKERDQVKTDTVATFIRELTQHLNDLVTGRSHFFNLSSPCRS